MVRPGVKKDLVQSRALAVGIISPVHFQLGPEQRSDVILEGNIALHLIAQRRDIGHGQNASQRRLDVKVALSFSHGQCGL